MVLLFLLFIKVPFAQPFSGFNNFYNIADTAYNCEAYSIVQSNNGYISGGFLNSSDDDFRKRLFLFEINNSGDKLWTTSYDCDSLAIYPSRCKINRLNEFAFEWVCRFSDTIDSSPKTYPAIIRFNGAGLITDTMVFYLPDTFENHNPYVSLKTSDGGLLIGYADDSIADMLIKINRDDEIEWIKQIILPYPIPLAFIESMEQLSDDSYLLSLDRGYDTWVVVLSTEGVVKWWKKTGGPLNDNECYAIEGFDSTILMVNIFTTEDYYWWHEPVKMKFEVSLFDFSGNLIKRNLFNEIYDKANIEGVVRDTDSTFVFFGNNSLYDYTYMYRVSNNGDSLLFKNLQPISEDDHSLVTDGIITPDGSLLFNGYGTLQIGSSYYACLSWIIKTDWYGCYEPLCDSTAVYVLNINTPESICKGNITYVSVLASGPQLWYEWQFFNDGNWLNLNDSQFYSGTKTDKLYIDSSFGNDSLRLRCKVGNEWWSKYSHETILHFKESPFIVQNPTSFIGNVNDNVQFTVTADGEEPLLYSWFFNDSPSILGDSNTLVINNISAANTGNYYCRITNECGEIYSDTVRLDILSSTEKKAFNSSIFVYPNPSNGNFNLLFPENLKGHNAQVTIYTQQGIEKYNRYLSLSKKITIDEKNWLPGRYFIKVITQDMILHATVLIVYP